MRSWAGMILTLHVFQRKLSRPEGHECSRPCLKDQERSAADPRNPRKLFEDRPRWALPRKAQPSAVMAHCPQGKKTPTPVLLLLPLWPQLVGFALAQLQLAFEGTLLQIPGIKNTCTSALLSPPYSKFFLLTLTVYLQPDWLCWGPIFVAHVTDVALLFILTA